MRAIDFKNVWEKYRIKYIRQGKVSWEEFWALKDISFYVGKSEVLGILGRNGAGKTTILKLIAGMITEDEGEVSVKGKVSTLMELGAGFNPELTGRENIIFNANIYGIPQERMERSLEMIAGFAELGKFIDAPLKYYSAGMYARLAFSLAVHVDPDILLVDDILAVGDEGFQRKCREKIFNLKRENKTIVLVSHDTDTLMKLCDRVMLVDEGKIIAIDRPENVIALYLEGIGPADGIAVLEGSGMRVTFNNGKIFINHGALPIGQNRFSYFVFWDEKINGWVPSYVFEWKVQEKGGNHISCLGVLKDEDVRMNARIELTDDGIRFDLGIDTDNVFEIKDGHWDLMISEKYDAYIYNTTHYSFPQIASRKDWQEVFKMNQARCLGLSAENSRLPYIAIEKQREEDIIRIFNTGNDINKRVISLWPSSNHMQFMLRFFETKEAMEGFVFASYDSFLKESREKKNKFFNDHTISSGPLRLLVDPDSRSVNLYYKEKQMTIAGGFDCSFKCMGKTSNTFYSSVFRTVKNDNSIILDIFWNEFSLHQQWTFYFNGPSLCWDIFQKKDSQDISLEDFKIGLILLPDYEGFFCGGQQGRFDPEFTVWHDLGLDSPDSRQAGMRNTDKLPAVVLESVDMDCSFVVQSGDSFTKCRTLQKKPNAEIVNKEKFNLCMKIDIPDDKKESMDIQGGV